MVMQFGNILQNALGFTLIFVFVYVGLEPAYVPVQGCCDVKTHHIAARKLRPRGSNPKSTIGGSL